MNGLLIGLFLPWWGAIFQKRQKTDHAERDVAIIIGSGCGDGTGARGRQHALEDRADETHQTPDRGDADRTRADEADLRSPNVVSE